MMRALVSRDDLAEYFTKLDPRTLQRSLMTLPSQKHVVLVFDEDDPIPGTLPSRIIVPDKEIDELFAWAATYIDVLSPLSAFVEVITNDETDRASKSTLSPNRRNAILAIVVIEAAIQLLKSRAKAGRGLYSASLRCASWIYAQLILNGSGREISLDVLQRWTKLRSTLTGITLPFALEHVTTFWQAATPALTLDGPNSSDERLFQINRTFLEYGEVGFKDWHAHLAGSPDISTLDTVMRGPRQARVELFNAASDQLPSDDAGQQFYAAFLGFLGARVGDGDLALWNLALDRSARFPTMPLWFAFYCGGNPNSRSLDFQRSVARRLLLDFNKNIYDADARELLVLSRGSAAFISDVPLQNPNNLRARFGKNIVGSFLVRENVNTSLTTPSVATAPAEKPKRIDEHDEAMFAEMLRDARMALERSMLILSKMQLSLPPPPSTDVGAQQGHLSLDRLDGGRNKAAKSRRGKA